MESWKERIATSGLSKNEISNLTGISNTYLKLIESGKENGKAPSLGRDKIIILALIAFEMTLKETNLLLRQHGMREINELDASFLIEVSEKKKTIKSFQAVRPFFAFDLLILSLEAQPGDAFIVYDKPHMALMNRAPEYDILCNPALNDEEYTQLALQLRLHFHKRRQELFRNSLESGYKIELMICPLCLKNHIYKALEPELRPYILDHFKRTLQYLTIYPDSFKISLARNCPRMFFQIKTAIDKTAESSKLFFVSPSANRHVSRDENPDELIPAYDRHLVNGFATDSKQVLGKFMDDFQFLKMSAYETDVSDYIATEFDKIGIDVNSGEK